MGLMSGIRSLFKRNEPVVVDLAGPRPQPRESPMLHLRTDAESGDGRSAMLEIKSTGGPRSLADLQRGYGEVMDLVRKISDHLDAQSTRTAQVSAVIERLPQVIEQLPELNRHNARLLDVLGDHLERAKSRDSSISAALTHLNETSSHQSEVLGLIQRQLDTTQQSNSRIADALTDLRQSLNDMTANSNRSMATMASLADAGAARDTRLASLLGRMQRWVIAAVVCLILALAAAIVAASWLLLRTSAAP